VLPNRAKQNRSSITAKGKSFHRDSAVLARCFVWSPFAKLCNHGIASSRVIASNGARRSGPLHFPMPRAEPRVT
jgi:hypothetical protein